MPDTIDKKFETIGKGGYSGHYISENYVILDNTEWEDLWEMTNSIKSPSPEQPTIDFKHEMVLGVYQGTRPNGGYNIEISKILEKEDCLEVYVKENKPEKGFFYTQAIVHPYHLIKTDLTDKEVKFIR